MTMEGEERVLPCGHRIGELLALVSDGPGAERELAAHTRTCPHCGAELAELDREWDQVRKAADAPVLTPPGLVDRVLASVHGLRGRITAEPVELDQEGGTLRISQRAVLTLARRLATDFAAQHRGVHIRAVAGDDDGIQVLMAVRYPAPANDLATELRGHLGHRLAQELGHGAPVVSVHVVDVHESPPSG